MIVLHGNKVDWKTLHHLALGLPNLEEIHLSNNGLGNPDGSFRHENVRQLFLELEQKKAAGQCMFQPWGMDVSASGQVHHLPHA